MSEPETRRVSLNDALLMLAQPINGSPEARTPAQGYRLMAMQPRIGVAPDEDLRGLLLSLAQEEAKHKLRFEIEYDDRILTEN